MSSSDQGDQEIKVSPLHWLAPRVTISSEAVRWSCLLEATSPKSGNVSPGVSFSDLCYLDFVTAANVAAEAFEKHRPFARAIFEAAKITAEMCRTNVNLGILLLLGPLVAADELLSQRNVTSPVTEDWLEAIEQVLSTMEQEDQQLIFQAIAIANAGGLGEVDQWDVNQTHERVDLLAAMADAAKRGDRIARQYQSGFSDLLTDVVPVLMAAIREAGDVLYGIMQAQVQLLASSHDSLILRKNDAVTAEQVRVAASDVRITDPWQHSQLDQSLRTGGGHHLNPGTTADLIAAALYVLLRNMPEARGESREAV